MTMQDLGKFKGCAYVKFYFNPYKTYWVYTDDKFHCIYWMMYFVAYWPPPWRTRSSSPWWGPTRWCSAPRWWTGRRTRTPPRTSRSPCPGFGTSEVRGVEEGVDLIEPFANTSKSICNVPYAYVRKQFISNLHLQHRAERTPQTQQRQQPKWYTMWRIETVSASAKPGKWVDNSKVHCNWPSMSFIIVKQFSYTKTFIFFATCCEHF